MEQTYCIYKITNQINGKAYIGFTKNFMKRMWDHNRTANKGKGQAIHAAIRKYGWDNFSKEELYYSTDKQHALDMEDVFINLHETKGVKGYNVTRGGQQGPPKGYVRKPMTKEQLARFHDRAEDPEIRRKISEALRGNKNRLGRPHVVTEKMKEKMSEAQKGHHPPNEHQKEVARAFMKGNKYALGSKLSEERKQKLREAARNMDHSYKRKPHSIEHRSKISEALDQYYKNHPPIMKNFICNGCLVPFQRSNYVKRGKYCSLACYQKSRKKLAVTAVT